MDCPYVSAPGNIPVMLPDESSFKNELSPLSDFLVFTDKDTIVKFKLCTEDSR